MESRKTVLMNLPAGQQWRHRHGGQTGTWVAGEKGKGGMDGESSMETQTLPYVTDSQRETAVWLMELTPGLCNNNGVGWGGRVQGRDMCIPMADSCCCMAETNTII